MTTDDLETLNTRFAIADHLSFINGRGGLPVAEVHNAHASASIALLGGHVLAYQPHGHAPVLRVSDPNSGQAIHSGIPVCWPWFGQHPTDATKPIHGFARMVLWTVLATEIVAGGATLIRLGLTDSDTTRVLWPFPFDLQIAITVGPELQVELITHNTGTDATTYGCALHSYFSVSDVTAIMIHGLEDCAYLDKVDHGQRKVQHGPVTISAETDRIYLDTAATCVIEDTGLGRAIRVAKAGSRSTVVWNPWMYEAQLMPDFGHDEYLHMVCVETTNAATDVVTIAPGGEHRISAVISSIELT